MAGWISLSHVLGAIVIVTVVHFILSQSLASPVDEVDGLRVFSYAAINESTTHRSDRISSAIRLFLFFRTIQYCIALEVPIVTIRFTFDQAGTFTTPCTRNGLTSSFINRKDI